MKDINWLIVGLILPLVLASGIISGSQLITANRQAPQQILSRLSDSLVATLALAGENLSDLFPNQAQKIKFGLTVTPSTGNVARDEALKKSLSQMFADKVDIQMDEDGKSGVVTPIFQDGQRGGDYIFVLNPLP